MQPIESVFEEQEAKEENVENDDHAHRFPFTDFAFFVVFLLFCSGMFFIAAFAFSYGNPLRLAYGYDSFGNICGVKNPSVGNYSYSGMDMTDRRYLFFMNIWDPRNSMKICVKECPTRTLNTMQDLKDFTNETGSQLCLYGVSFENNTEDQMPNGATAIFGQCPAFPVYKSSSVLNRCVPTAAQNIVSEIIYNIHAYLNSFDPLEKALGDLYASWQEIFLMGIFSCALSILMCVIIYWMARFVFTIFALTVSFAAIGGTGLLWVTYTDIKRTLDATPENEILDEVVNNESAFLFYSIAATAFTVILLLVVFKMNKKLYQVAELFEDASKCLRSIPCLFLQPVITLAALTIYLVFWVTVMLSIATACHHTSQNITLSLLGAKLDAELSRYNTLTVIEYSDPTWVRYMWWYYILALWFGCEFILSCQQMVISYSVAEWYFGRENPDGRTRFFVVKAMQQTCFYHLGSLAKGSFLICIFKVPRLILIFLDKQLAKCEDHRCSNCCRLVCCRCCFLCLEKFIRCIHHNAFTIIAIQRMNFCRAAKLACAVLLENAGLVTAVNTAGDFILLLGKLSVTAITAIVGLLVMKHNPELHLYAVPILVISIFAFFVSHCILSLFEMIVDTLLLCYCEDYHMNLTPKHASTTLQAYIRAANPTYRKLDLRPEQRQLIASLETSI